MISVDTFFLTYFNTTEINTGKTVEKIQYEWAQNRANQTKLSQEKLSFYNQKLDFFGPPCK